jgi:predicted flap endonuclease-1-like 5' DNA nuclease
MSYILSQNIVLVLLAALIGALIAYMLGLCNGNQTGLESERDTLRSERDELSARLASAGGGAAAGVAVANAGYDRKIAGLEAELAEARVKADELAAAQVSAKASSEPAMDNEDAAAMKWRNRYLEARVKFLEVQSSAAPVAATVRAAPLAQKAPIAAALVSVAVGAIPNKAEAKSKGGTDVATKSQPITNENFKPSALAQLSGEEMEVATLAAAANAKAPPRSRKRANPDDLLLIDGVGPKNNTWLNENGIYYFHQIATMDIEHIAWLSENLPTFGSRVYRENWVAQCTKLARSKPARTQG